MNESKFMLERLAMTKSHLAEWFLHPLLAGENHAFLWFLDGSRNKPMAYKEAGEWVGAYVRGLDALGIARGARAISLGSISPYLWLSTIAHSLQGLINVAIPMALDSAEHMRIIYDSKVACLVLDDIKTLKSLLAMTELPPEVMCVIILQPKGSEVFTSPQLRVVFIDELMQLGRPQPDRVSQKRTANQPEETATILCFPTTADDIGMTDSNSTVLKRTHAEWGETYRTLIDLFQKASVNVGQENMLVMSDWQNPAAYAAAYIFPILNAKTLGFLPPNSSVLGALTQLQPSLLVANAKTLEELRHELHTHVQTQGDWFERFTYQQALKIGKTNYENPEKIKGWRKYYANLLQDIFIKTFSKSMGGKLKTILSVDEDTPYQTQLFYYSFGIDLVEVPNAFEKQFEKRNW